MSAGSSRIRLILRARISAIHRQIAHLFKPLPAVPNKIGVSTLIEAWRQFVRSIQIGPSALRHPPTSVDIPASRKSVIRRDMYPTMIALTISLCNVAVNRGRSTDFPAIDTWLDRHPRTMVGCPVPRRRVISSLPPNVCWCRRLPRHPPLQRLVSALYSCFLNEKYRLKFWFDI